MIYVTCPDCLELWTPDGGDRRRKRCSACVTKFKVRRCARCAESFQPTGPSGSRASYCRDCHSANQKAWRDERLGRNKQCLTCDAPLPKRHSKFCSDECAPAGSNHPDRFANAICATCGDSFTNCFGGREHCRICSPPGADRPVRHEREKSRRSNQRRRLAKRNGGPAGNYTTAEIAERDNYRCHLCGKKVDMSLDGNAKYGPNIDHLIPLSRGGLDERVNVRLAHRVCNVRRGVGGEVQLLLVG